MTLDDFMNDPEADAELRAGTKRRPKVTQEEHKRYVQDRMFELFDNWKPSKSPEDTYKSACSAVRELSVEPSLADIAQFSNHPKLDSDFHSDFGIFLSALINQTIKNDETITIRPRQWISDYYLGAFLERGVLIVDGKVRDNTAYKQKGGTVIVNGDTFGRFGDYMEDGDLIIEGVVHGAGLSHIKGGHGVIRRINQEQYKYDSIAINYGLGAFQEGGRIEIFSDVPQIYSSLWDLGMVGVSNGGIGYKQSSGKLFVKGNVNCDVNSYQTGGETLVKGDVVGASVGYRKKGGETVIDGRVLRTDYSSSPIGPSQEGGLIKILKDVYGPVAYDGYPNAEIIIEGNVHGENIHSDIGDYNTHGTRITIKGDVHGKVGHFVKAFNCTIHGDVHGDVGRYFGFYNHESERTRDGVIEVKGNVHGDVGTDMRFRSKIIIEGNVTGTVGQDMHGGEIHVGGGIGRIGASIDGKVYQRGRDVTYIPLWKAALRGIAGKNFPR